MRIKILRACVTGRASLNPGTVVDFPDPMARDMIHHGIAAPVADASATVTELPVEKPKRKPRRHKCGMQ